MAISLAVGFWLFGDTYARHSGGSPDDRTIRFAHFGSYQDYRLWRQVIAEFECARPASLEGKILYDSAA